MAAVMEEPSKVLTALLVLRYNGPRVDDGKMDVYSVARNLTSFSQYVERAVHAAFGRAISVEADVRGFEHGSFATEIAFTLGNLASVWPLIPSAVSVAKTIKDSIGLLKFFNGERPAKIESHGNGSVAVYNNSGSIQVTNVASLNLSLDARAGEMLGQFIVNTLGLRGVNSVSIETPEGPLASVNRSEAKCFDEVGVRAPIQETIIQLPLTIEGVGFSKRGSWVFSDPSGTVFSNLSDPDFLRRVEEGESFRKGDVLVADVSIKEYLVPVDSTFSRKVEIVKVVEHHKGPELEA